MPIYGQQNPDDALSSLFKGLASDQEDRNQTKLALALQSKKIQAETEAKMQEADYNRKINSISGPQLQALGGFIANPDKTKNPLDATLFPNGAPPAVSDALMGAIAMGQRAQSMFNKPRGAKYVDNNNLEHEQVYTPDGQVLSDHATGLEKKAHDAINASDAGYHQMNQILDNMNNRVQGILTNHPELAALQRGAVSLQQLYPYDPKLKAYMDDLASRALQITKATTGQAGRSWEMVKAEMNAYPGPNDTLESADQKIQQRKQDILAAANGAHASYDPSNFLKSHLHPAFTQQQGGLNLGSLDEFNQFRQARNGAMNGTAKPK